jgi:colanic acid biosynthesis glycosyl transferase WcaI
MRLTLINQFYAPDLAPTGHMATSLATHRASNGDRVTVITSTGGYVSETRIQSKSPQTNPQVFRLWTPRLGKAHKFNRILDYTAFYLLAAVRMLFLPRQDVIISLTTPPFIAWTAILHKWLHPATRIVLWNMDCYPEIAERTGVIAEGGWLSRVLRALNRQLFKRLDAVVCLDRAMHDLLQAHYGQGHCSPKFQIIPNWEAITQFPAGLTPPPWADDPTVDLESPFTIIYLGNAGFGHRFETVVEAAEQLKDDPFIFLFVGGGQKWTWLADAVKTRGLENVILRPYVPKETTPAVMATADCALITMTNEALGLISPSKLHANLAMQLPILYIGPEHSNIDEAIQTYGFGLSLRHGDVSAMVKYLRKLRNDVPFHVQHRKAARQAFEEAFCDTQTLPQFDQLLNSLTTDTDRGFPT